MYNCVVTFLTIIFCTILFQTLQAQNIDNDLGGNTDQVGFYIINSDGDTLFTCLGDGLVGIAIGNPSEQLQVDGVIHSISRGFRFPDGSIQTTAATGGGNGFPSPDYDSGWQSMPADQVTLQHNLGGNLDNYVVDLQMWDQYPEGDGRHIYRYGGYLYSGGTTNVIHGCYWTNLTTTSITVQWRYTAAEDRFRIRIWVYQ
jgi:hypothetical protein